MEPVTVRIFEEIVGVLKEVQNEGSATKVVLHCAGKDCYLILPFSSSEADSLRAKLGTKIGILRTDGGFLLRKIEIPDEPFVGEPHRGRRLEN